MLRTAPNFSNSTNRVPAHSLRHQTSASFARFLLKRTQLTTLLQQLAHCGEAAAENVYLLIHENVIKVHMCLAYQFKTVIIES